MIKIFKNNILLQTVIVVAVALASWLMSMHTSTMPAPLDSAPLYNLIYNLLEPYPIACSCIALFLILAEGLLLAMILNDHKMIPQNTILPMLFFVTTMSIGGPSLNPILFVNFVLLIIIHKLLLRGTPYTVSFDTVISVSAWISIASMFFMPAIFLVIPLVMSFIIYNLYHWRSWVMLLLGLLAPYIIYLSILFCCGLPFKTPTIDWHQYASLFQFSTTQLLSCIYFLIAFWSIITVLDTQRERVVIYRKNTSIMLNAAWGALPISIFAAWSGTFSEILQLFAVPFAYTLSLMFLNAKGRKWIWETLFILLIAIPLVVASL